MASYMLLKSKDDSLYYGAVILYDDGELDAFGKYEDMIFTPDGDLTSVGQKIKNGVPMRAYSQWSHLSKLQLVTKSNLQDDDVEFLEDLDYVKP